MFALLAKTPAGPTYYTGRAGVCWVNRDRREAFKFETMQLATARRAAFNANTLLHGLTFAVTRIS